MGLQPILLLRTIKKFNWTEYRLGISFLMIGMQPPGGCGSTVCGSLPIFPPPQSFGANLSGQVGMKLAGFLLLLAGWGIVVSTVPLLPSLPMRAAFVLAGVAVELTGLGLVVRSHLVPKG